jgi:hypothetical protein
MGLRARRRTVVVWRASRGPAGRYSLTALPRPAGTRRLRRLLRLGALLTAVGLIRLGHALRLRWLPLLAGGVLTATGIVLNDGAGALAFLAGFLFLFAALIMHVSPPADRERRLALEHELADYSTPAERRDIEAILNRYSDEDTSELRDILTRQAAATHDDGVPGIGRFPVNPR